ncbi:MAG: hypothetical protein ACI39H_02955 [Lachnospiraceae bacterium]
MNNKFSISKYREQGAKIFTDRDTGLRARAEIGLDQKDERQEEVWIQLPSDTWGINPSFFGGLFESSLKQYGKPGFEEKYHFEYTNGESLKESLVEDIEDDIGYVLRSIKKKDA